MSRATVPLASGVATLGAVLAVVLAAGVVGPPAVAEGTGLPTVDRLANPAAADNPWGKRTVTVHVVHEDTESDRLDPLAERELDHWEANSPRYADSNVSFDVIGDRGPADLAIVFQADVGCGPERNAVGCSRTRTDDRTGRVTSATVWVETGHEESFTREVLRHELGHVFGLSHDDADEFPFMHYAIRGEPEGFDSDETE
ncbi:zinc-dependent metalloprotease family protein [Halorarum salinum]|uniref:Matrixin n=1 Tax=Halorarum salinum TaxID=2743089 RepID=A0A7D5QBV2_9EURY|nr:zinc-dependent metalloprotease family protein [Halobaculum salinum]QLG62559.1 hypothetical protein HUG12_12830 [Halobaculum salinum]